jgi:Mannosyl-glycoprotein endo-beta-N-acetylglucosaminidase
VVAPIAPVEIGQLREAREPADTQAARAQGPGFKAVLDEASGISPGLVPVVRTRLSPGQAQEALRAAWTQVHGEPPSDKTLALVTAQWAHETGNGASMYNYNFAGIKGSGPSGLSVAQRTREGHGASERRIVDNFRAYRSAEEGATDYVQLLARRFPEAVQGAKQGDPAAFVGGLKQRGYFTGDQGAYLRNVSSIASRYLGEPLPVTEGAPTTIDYQPRTGGPPSLDLRGLYAEMTPSPDAFVDAISITDQINRAALRAFTGKKDDA